MKFFISIATVICLLQFSGCSKSSSTSPQDVVKAQLMGTWALQSASADNVDETSVFQGMSLQFGTGTYATTNGKAVWPATGTWTFASADGKTIKRDDDLMISINEITSTSLKISFTWSGTTLGEGRESSVGGQNVFSFIKQ